MSRILAFIYGVVCYLISMITILYSIGFVGNLIVPKTLDSDFDGSLINGILIDILLLGLFAIQHSLMARQSFKKWWTKIIPHPIERSTYVLMASLALLLLFWQWHSLGGIIWNIQSPIASNIIYGIFALGWLIVLISTFMINHFDLFGLRQVYLYLRSQEYEYLGFRTPGFYKYVRHPIMLGFVIVFWATPTMTFSHFIFALGTTIYTLVGIKLEEVDMISIYGDLYQEYRQQVSMLIPMPRIKLTEEKVQE
ncbi:MULTISPECIES: methanethiol S-methyltransferase [Okeania]|uniref:methanethiol S-methyltransferase n=1 Tax=Okeania TaxID=1458928 RepID=UPI000F53AACF|nr:MULTISPECIES: methanethiol S-methyltransferase [Okeania]NES92282.1 isoprenylcysteine carboxylmethyltransferase family protein [Okeania sp. SIO2B9]RQH11902.1 isoprenylcysteine carboxylmethyltransferase family protein [Okeania hirsuta]